MNPRVFSSSRAFALSLLVAAASASTGCESLAALLAEIGEVAATPLDEPPPPPPLSGGTLLVTQDGAVAVAADTDSDRIFVVDLETNRIMHDIALAPGDEPGRVAEGPDGVAYVALRSGGAVAAVDLATGALKRREVCPSPRGIAYDADKDELHVACAGGELVTLPSDPGAAPSRTLHLERDLRDVVVQGDTLLVSRFRAAEVLRVSAEGKVESRIGPDAYMSPNKRSFEPAVAWRMIPVPGGAAMVHQRGSSDPVSIGSSAGASSYGGLGPCDQAIVHAAVTVFDAEASARLTLSGKGALGNITLPVDMAASLDGRIAVVGAGSSVVVQTSLGTVQYEDGMESCALAGAQTINALNPVAVAYGSEGRLFVQGRDALLFTYDPDGQLLSTIPFPEARRIHTGHRMFHTVASPTSPVACASCHPEGRDDGRVWNFDTLGPRRTQTMLGGVLDTAPLHWDGDMESIDAIMAEVFVKRMGGSDPGEYGVEAMADWVQSLPALPAAMPSDDEAAVRGAALFTSPEVGCAACHSGSALTNNKTVDVGTGKAFQVPSLVGIADRAPFMHDGCAATLLDRFDPSCGGGDKHGKTSHLTAEEVDDLIVYLESL